MLRACLLRDVAPGGACARGGLLACRRWQRDYVTRGKHEDTLSRAFTPDQPALNPFTFLFTISPVRETFFAATLKLSPLFDSAFNVYIERLIGPIN